MVELRTFRGHKGSVKAVTTRDGAVFASGGRDGSICLWDERAPTPRPVLSVPEAHAPTATAPGNKRRRSGMSAPQTVSSLVYLHDKLASAGATDGAVKLWDARMLGSGRNKAKGPSPFGTLIPPNPASGRARGITSIALDATGGRLLAASTNSLIYMYDTRHLHDTGGSRQEARSSADQVPTFSGHRVDSYYVKSSFSTDGRFIVSGSSDGGVYVWEADRPEQKPTVLWGHASEVCSVAWCPIDFTTVVSASDDTTVRVWRVDREHGLAAQQTEARRRDALQHPPLTPQTQTQPPQPAANRQHHHRSIDDESIAPLAPPFTSPHQGGEPLPQPPPQPGGPEPSPGGASTTDATAPPPPPLPPPSSARATSSATSSTPLAGTLRAWLVPAPAPQPRRPREADQA